MRTAAALCGVVAVLTACTPQGGPIVAQSPAQAPHSATSVPTTTQPCEDPCTSTHTSPRTASVSATATHATPKAGASAPSATPKPADSTKPPYSRDAFGSGWSDPDRNGCDARQDAVARATSNRVYDGRCRIVVGDVFDRYTGRTYPKVRTSSFDVDHVVSLHDAWESGAFKWARAKRVAYANDPSVLVLTTASANRSKSDQGPDTWAPASHDGACWFVRQYRNIKRVWALHTTSAQRKAIRNTIATCNGTEGR